MFFGFIFSVSILCLLSVSLNFLFGSIEYPLDYFLNYGKFVFLVLNIFTGYFYFLSEFPDLLWYQPVWLATHILYLSIWTVCLTYSKFVFLVLNIFTGYFYFLSEFPDLLWYLASLTSHPHTVSVYLDSFSECMSSCMMKFQFYHCLISEKTYTRWCSYQHFTKVIMEDW